MDPSRKADGSWSTAAGIEAIHTIPDALQALSTSEPDAVLLMEHGDLPETLRLLQAVRDVTPAPLLVLGPKDDSQLVREVLLAGASDYVGVEDIATATISLAVECAIAREKHIAETSRELYQRHAEALQADRKRLRSALINQISDRLQNPITIIRLQSRILSNRVPEDCKRAVTALDSASKRLEELISQVTTAFKVQQHELELSPEDQDLWELMRDVAKEPEFSDRRQDITIARTAENVHAQVDGVAGNRILRYLMRQVMRLTRTGDKIDIAVGPFQELSRVSIQFPRALKPQEVDSLFDAFSGSDDEDRFTDLGLELYVARILGQHLGAQISLSSTGAGSMFQVTFPRGSDPSITTTIALISDNPEGVGAARDAIRAAKVEAKIVAAKTWEAAAPALSNGHADIAILHLESPQQTEALRRHLEQLEPPVHVVDARAVTDLVAAVANALALLRR